MWFFSYLIFVDELRELKTNFKDFKNSQEQKLSRRSGSKLTDGDLQNFGIVGVIDLPENESVDQRIHEEIKNLLRRLANEITEMRRTKKKIRELDDIQPKTYDFFQNCCQIFFSDHWKDMDLTNSKNQMSKTSYSALLFNQISLKSILVEGNTDQTLYYKNFPMAIWEDKNIDLHLTSPSEIG